MDHPEARRYEEQLNERAIDAGVDLNIGTFALALNLVRAANVLVADLEQEIYRHRGISYAGFRILFALWVVGPTEPKRLATLASVTRSSTSSVLNTLERDGFVERRRESADRRLVTTQLTDDGLKLVLETLEEHQAFLSKWTSPLTEKDRQEMSGLLHKLLTGSD